MPTPGILKPEAVESLRDNRRPEISFDSVSGDPHLFYGVPDRAGGVLLIDLPMEREQAMIRRFFGQSYLSSSALGYILVALLLFGVLRPALLLAQSHRLPEDERRET